MAYIAVTYSFSNSTTADATQVNQNFQDIIDGLSNGTKDLSVSAVTAAGNLTVSGNTTLGNASSDDITFTGSAASSLPIKTTATYDIGSSTLGLRAAYFGGNSQTVNIKGSGSMSATWTFTLPVSAGTSTYVLQTDGSGVSSWVSKTVMSTVAKTTTYTATSADDTILCSTSGGAWTLTLPAAASNSGKIFTIKKTTSDASALTIDGNASETIDGATTIKILVQYESVIIQCDGSNWHILNWAPISGTYTPTLTNSTNVAASTARLCSYIKNRNVVTVTGTCDVDPTSGSSTTTVLGVSLPVASNLATTNILSGTGTCTGDSTSFQISEDTSNDRATITYKPVGAGNEGVYFTFSYSIE